MSDHAGVLEELKKMKIMQDINIQAYYEQNDKLINHNERIVPLYVTIVSLQIIQIFNSIKVIIRQK